MPIYPSKKSSVVSKSKKHQSKLGIVLVVIFSIILANLLFGLLGFVNSFLLGAFGLAVYPLCIFMIALGIMKIRRVKVKLVKREIVYLILAVASLFAIAHLITSESIINGGYVEYLADTYTCSKGFTAGGFVYSLIVYPIYNVVFTAGASVVFAILLLLFLSLFVDSLYRRKQTRVYIEDTQTTVVTNQQKEADDNQDQDETTDSNVVMSNNHSFDDDLFIKDDEEVDEDDAEQNTDKSNAMRILGLDRDNNGVDEEDEDLFEQDEDVEYSPSVKPQMVVHEENYDVDEDNDDVGSQILSNSYFANTSHSDKKREEDLAKYEKRQKDKAYLEDIMGYESSYTTNRSDAKERLFGDNYSTNDKSNRSNNRNQNNNRYNTKVDNRSVDHKYTVSTVGEDKDIYDSNLTLKSYEKNKTEYIDRLNKFDTASSQIAKASKVYNMNENTNRVEAKAYTSNVVNVNEINKIKPMAEKTNVKRRPYVKPPIDLLETYVNDTTLEENNEEKARRLEETLNSFKIPAKVCSVAKGPSFTRFELTMPTGISVKKIDNLVPDMQMALACKGAIRTEIPIPGKNAFGVEIPNDNKETVGLRDIIESYDFQNSKYKTAYGLGKDISNSPIVGNIEKMPHLLVAGTTGSGKSVCLNSMLVSLLYKSGPEDLRLILIDPKRLEFSLYNGLPHLLIPNVITDKEKAMNAFDWLIDEMNRRINYFESLKAGIRNIDEYNSSANVKSGQWEKMPTIVVVVDELNELMMQTRKEMESKIVRIAQLSRAVGIHLVLATQRPSVDVITGLVKSNLPSRIAFAVSSFNDSMTILGQGGAESLLGFGDMLYSPVGSNKPHRIQGAFLKNSEVERVVEFIKANNDCIFDEEIEDQMFNRNQDTNDGMGGNGVSVGGNANMQDPLMKDVCRFAIKSGGISTTKVQRYLRIGYPRAAKIVDDMEALGYISKKDDKNNRVIFMTQQEFEEVFGEDFE